MYRIHLAVSTVVTALTFVLATPVSGQESARSHAYDPSEQLTKAIRDENVRTHVLEVIAEARSRGLPAQALERTALKGAARNVPERDIERAVVAQAERLGRVQDALARVSGHRASGAEIEAGAEAMRQGVDVTELVKLATDAPSGRSLDVPMHVLGSLVARGLPSKDALAAVLERLDARAPDSEIAQLPEQVTTRPGGKPSLTGRELAGTKRPGSVGAPPAGVPANGGAEVRPAVPKPTTPAGRP